MQFFVLPDLDKKIDESIHDAINYFEKKCPYCSDSLYSGHIRNKIHIDHFIPIAKGGQNVPWNILPVCQKCNSKKHSKKPGIFLNPDTYIKCQDYLQIISDKYVGDIQVNLEKFIQIKVILKELHNKKHSKEKLNDTIDLLSQIALDLKPNKNILNIDHLNYIFEDYENIITKYFKIPESEDKILKFSITEIHEILSKKLNKEINRTRLSKKLKQLGFIQQVERTPEKIKRCFSLTLKEKG